MLHLVPPGLTLMTETPLVTVEEFGVAVLSCSPSIDTVILMWIAETQLVFNTSRYHLPESACTDEYCHSIVVTNLTRNSEGRYFCYIRGDRASIFESLDDPLVPPAVVTLIINC